jgi:hypothetical protein
MFYHKNNFIKLAGIASIAILMFTQGCKKSFLDVPAQGQAPSSVFFKTPADATEAINAIYGNLRENHETGFAAIAVESMGSDEAEKGSDPGDAAYFNDFDTFTQNSSESQISDFWNGQYASINLCNQAIDSIPPINMDATLKTRYVAEAKFVRAYNYFRLVRAFGGVPLRMHYPKSGADFNLPRSTVAQVYTQIEQDLTDAASILPQNYGAADVGRATKGAALALHAKVCMYQKNRWSDVLTFTNQVMALGYSLFPNFEQSFRIPNENNPEEIFELQCPSIANNPAADNSQYSQIQGVRGIPSGAGGFGLNVPTPALVAAFEPGDPRLNATIIFRGSTTAEGDIIPATVTNPMYSYKPYVPFSVPWFSNQGEGQDVRVIRYADVLLMNAEAANETGNSALALSSLELVRARARAGNNAILPPVTTTDQATLRLAIWHERQVELAMEFDRFYDVIRQGRGAAVFGSKGFVTGKSELQPIPQNEIDLSAGLLKQNPGY